MNRLYCHKIFILSTAVFFGCSPGNFAQGISGTANRDDDVRRPTESGEGIPGYLTSPELVTIKADHGQLSASGSPGAVSTTDGKVTDVLVCLESYVDGIVAGAPVGVIDRAFANADGSFALSGPGGENLIVGINLSGRCADEVTDQLIDSIQSGKSYVAEPGEGDAYAEAPDLFPPLDAKPNEELRVCSDLAAGCDIPFVVQVSGANQITPNVTVTVTDASMCRFRDYKTENFGVCGFGQYDKITAYCGMEASQGITETTTCADDTYAKEEANEICLKYCQKQALITLETADGGKLPLFASRGLFIVVAENLGRLQSREVEVKTELSHIELVFETP